MASSFSSFAFPSSALDPGYNVTITQEELNLFYNNDRALFKRLVFKLGHSSSQAILVMALFLWLERTANHFTFVYKLLNWPDSYLTALVDEAIMTLDCLVSDQFLSTHRKNNLTMMQVLTNSEVTLHFFHEKRCGISRAVARIMNDVCFKVFSDILQHEQSIKELNSLGIVVEDDESMLNLGSFQNLETIPTRPTLKKSIYCNPSFGDFVSQRTQPMMREPELLGTQMAEGYLNVDLGLHNLQYQKDFLDNEISEIFSNLTLDAGNNAGKTRDVPLVFPPDRTIFMTFSRGYPISAVEIEDFFKSTFGDILEAICMQEVPNPWQQALYARLVVRSAENLKVVLGCTGKSKFTINGKHAWVRKYIHKN